MKTSAHLVLLLVLLAAGMTCMAQTYPGNRYRILSVDDDSDTKWADYLRSQLDRRSDRTCTSETTPQARTLDIVVSLDSTLSKDYTFRLQENRLILEARNPSTMLWLLYQAIAWIAQTDDCIRASDLPPVLLDPVSGASGRFPFEYRGIYSPTNCDPEFMAVNASHNVDYDWGIWGHNLRKILAGINDESLYAYHDGMRDSRQFCFSSDLLYRRIEAYIMDNYGDGGHSARADGTSGSRFCIMPDDNAVVCLCDQCRQVGNTRHNATPAVMTLLRRLAERFPAHLFFTASYLTTENPPTTRMPENGGVIVSAIDLPLQSGPDASTSRRSFEEKVRAWSYVTTRIYVWDYMRNFDDYLTPFPVLGILGERLKLFRELGINGIFYNGSGYDYAFLDDMQTFVIASMLKLEAPDLSILVSAYLDRYYPHSAHLLRDYYLGLERRVADKQARLEYYGGINDAIDAYLDPHEFEIFRTKLDAIAKTISGEERRRLNRMLTALDFTALELMRVPDGTPYDAEKAGNLLHDLEGHTAFPEMVNYKETGGTIDAYLNLWREYGARTRTPEGLHRLHTSFVGSADNTADLEALSDGICGFPSDYHTAWYSFGKDEIRAEMTFDHPCTLIVAGGFLHAPKWRIVLPAEFSVTRNGRERHLADFGPQPEPFSKITARIELHVSAGDTVRISVKPNGTPGIRAACDEIEIYEKE